MTARCRIFSLEMSSEALLQRLLCFARDCRPRTRCAPVRVGDDMKKIVRAMEELSQVHALYRTIRPGSR